MRTIKASELGSFRYCRRAWWYQLQGEPSENTAALAAGSARHAGHARGVKSALLLKWLAVALLLVGLVYVLLGVLQ
ncbi:MAG: hypothetical protein WBI14_08205 [Anaerolineaceae bacterium]